MSISKNDFGFSANEGGTQSVPGTEFDGQPEARVNSAQFTIMQIELLCTIYD
jgi:hypothetical protein